MADTRARTLIDAWLAATVPLLEEPVAGTYLCVLFPADMDPCERHGRFGAPLDAELRLAGVGCADGGGTLYDMGDDAEDEPNALFTLLDCEATDIAVARAVLRTHLPELGCPAGTVVQWGAHEDRWDGARWHLAQPRSAWEEGEHDDDDDDDGEDIG